MYCIGIWEQNQEIYPTCMREMNRAGASASVLLSGCDPKQFEDAQMDLFVISLKSERSILHTPIRCRALLLPGSLGPLARQIECDWVVSYGSSARDTLTHSSIEGDRICISVQRELVTLAGGTAEQQELVRKRFPGISRESELAVIGIFLLCGIPL